ncbi:RecQ family ATP-dependent DNA helicase [Salinibacillus xinjiangensis]|uniref:RecQ family ATP-dependent DNA helicase n=2 Tax=Salinibacillus xinjiangensis TaxID=1229268 RepID=A0A6G1X684_9BACI|nr:RecQ family ATP-dependent DNA helicase [Salinibacillus xinjiangensis]
MSNEQLIAELKKHFGFTHFRTGQQEIIQDLMAGQDVLGILPTGTGKSLCYQLPAMCQEGITIVVSPLLSLMVDQVKQLKAKGFKRVVAVNSLLDRQQKNAIMKHLHQYKLIYCSPEMLQNEFFLNRLTSLRISLFVVDEAHCISQWGHEFRTDYLKLNDVIKQLNHPTVLALSATATPQVQDDISYYLDKPNIRKRVFQMDRPNIAFAVEVVDHWQDKINRIVQILTEKPVPTMIYFSSRNWCEMTSETLKNQLKHLRIAFYHGGMDTEDRLLIQQQFMSNQLDVICCTSAFGMGVDKQNIRLVIHFHLPAQIESFIQEVGRAGRDGLQSVSLSLYAKGDEQIPLAFIEQELPTQRQTEHFYQYFSKKESLSNVDDETQDILMEHLQLNETQWRFLQYQLNQHHLAIVEEQEENWRKAFQNTLELIKQRTSHKMNKLFELMNWFEHKGCKRESLYEVFQDGFQRPDQFCCDYCDFTFEQWNPETIQRVQENNHWQAELRRLFHREELDEETVKSS